MAKVTVTSSGKLSNIRPKLVAGIDRGLILAAKVIAQDATFKAPIATGRLKRSITHGTPFNVEAGRGILIGTNMSYARFQEEGTSKMKAQPYLIPALEENTDLAKQIILTSVIGAIKGT